MSNFIKQGYYFWPIDEFPYLASGQGFLMDDGMVAIQSSPFGPEGWSVYRPVFEFTDPFQYEAVEFQVELNQLRENRQKELNAVEQKYRASLHEIRDKYPDHLVIYTTRSELKNK